MKTTNSIADRRFVWMLVPAAVLLAVLVYYPVIEGIGTAFMRYTMLDLSQTRFNGVDNFIAVFSNPNISFLRILLNSFLWVSVSLVLQFLLGFALALLLRRPFPGRGFYTGCVFYTWALSGFAIGLVWAWLFNGQFGAINDVLLRIGLLKSPVGFLSDPNLALVSVIVANVWYGIPFFAIMLLAALQSVPNELYESAQLDGAGRVRQLFRVTIPYIKPTILSTVLLRLMWIMNFPEIIYGMTGGGPANATNILATEMINKTMKEYNYGQGAALGLVIMALLFLFAFLYLRTTSRDEFSL
jgi:multiple sugar transport system permease protein